MEFCPKCGCVLVEKKKDFGCQRCNYKAKSKVKIESSESIKLKPEIGVISSKQTDTFPVINAQCPKCSSNEAYFWTSQTRAGDETETKFFKCIKCHHTWREYR